VKYKQIQLKTNTALINLESRNMAIARQINLPSENNVLENY